MTATGWVPPFSSHLVLDERICESTIRAYYIGFDQGQFRLKPLANVIVDVIPEFALGYYQSGSSIPVASVVPRLREAARRIYSTEKYQKRGEFGELLLHLLLRDFCRSIPLVSKMYFKDADNVPIHGFDAVHVVDTGTNKQLWLGESKLYEDGHAGVNDLLGDLKKHLTAEYLKREFALIATKLPESCPDIEHWREMFHANKSLDSILNSVCIPMVCTYTSDIYKNHENNSNECSKAFLEECNSLRKVFEDGHKAITKVDIILMLVPVQSKAELVTELHNRLVAMQTQ